MIVWLASYPRSGNTFFRALLHTVYGKETYSIYNDPDIEQMGMAPILGQRRLSGTLARMRQEERVYFIKTHGLPPDESPAIYLIRDGRDAVVSHAHFVMGTVGRPGFHKRALWKLLGSNHFVRTLDDIVRGGPWYERTRARGIDDGWQDHVLAWTIDRKGGPIFVVRYEDLIADPRLWSQAALEGIGIPLEPSGRAPLAFDALHARWPKYFRKGRTASWRDEMPPDIHDMFWRRNRMAMLSYGYGSDAPAALQPASPVRSFPERIPSRTELEHGSATIGQASADRGGSSAVSMAGLGRGVDWGTTLFQYMFLKSFARQHGMVAEVPPWSGQNLFREVDAPITRQHEVVVCDNLTLSREPSNAIGTAVRVTVNPVGNRAGGGKTAYLLNDPLLNGAATELPFRRADLDGPFVLHSRALAPHRDYLRGVLQPAPVHEAVLQTALVRLRALGKTIIGIHALGRMRRLEVTDGDASVIPLSWYVKWLEHVWRRVEDPVLLLCTDDHQRVGRAFAQFNPVTVESLYAGAPPTDPALESTRPTKHSLTFIEWLLLTRCDLLAIANEPSSFAAAMMNAVAREFWRPGPQASALIHFDPWNAHPILSLPHRLTLSAEFAQRLRLVRANGGWRPTLASLGLMPWLYAGILGHRAATCFQLFGSSELLRELLSPGFYLAAHRVYGDQAVDHDAATQPGEEATMPLSQRKGSTGIEVTVGRG